MKASSKPSSKSFSRIHPSSAGARASAIVAFVALLFVGAYVSRLKACQYCYGVHAETAKAFGIDGALLELLLADPDHAPVDAKLRPILSYARKLTQDPARMMQADADAVFAAGTDYCR